METQKTKKYQDISCLTDYNNNDEASNKIGLQGCRYLCQADWKKIVAIYLKSNNIDDEGCSVLKYGDWKDLSKLGLKKNKITVNGCHSLSTGDWPKLKQITLIENQINEKDRQPIKLMFIQKDLNIVFE